MVGSLWEYELVSFYNFSLRKYIIIFIWIPRVQKKKKGEKRK